MSNSARSRTLSCLVFLLAACAWQTSSTAETYRPVYKPPELALDGTRVGGGSRGASSATILNVLAPDHTGLTLQGQPTLFWHLAGASGARVEVIITDEKADDPLFEKALVAAREERIESLSLAEHGVTLNPMVEYQWSVTVIPAASGGTAAELFASGTIQRIEPTAELSARIQQAPRAARPSIYAEAGVWYEALAELGKQMSDAGSEFGRRALREQRAYLLEQVGLQDAAAFDRGAR